MQKEWSKNKTPRAIMILLHLKNYALENSEGNMFCLNVFGSGCHVVANAVDNLIDDYNRAKTSLAHYEHMYRVEKECSDDWQKIGFDYMPSEYSTERQNELKTLAERWRKEDEENEE